MNSMSDHSGWSGAAPTNEVRTFFYAPHHRLDEFLSLGWISHDGLQDCYHGQFASLVEWGGEGEAVYPKRV